VHHRRALGCRSALAPSNHVSDFIALNTPAEGNLSVIGPGSVGCDSDGAGGDAPAECSDDEQLGGTEGQDHGSEA